MAEVGPQRIVGAAGGALEHQPGELGGGEAPGRPEQRRAPRLPVTVDRGDDGQLLAGDEADGLGDDVIDDDPPVARPDGALARRPLDGQLPLVERPPVIDHGCHPSPSRRSPPSTTDYFRLTVDFLNLSV